MMIINLLPQSTNNDDLTVWINAHKMTDIQIDHRRIVSRTTIITSLPNQILLPSM